MASTEGSVADRPNVAAPVTGAAEASTTTTINQWKGMERSEEADEDTMQEKSC